MGSPEKLFSAKQLEKLDKKQRAALKKEIQRHVKSSPEIRKILKAKVQPSLTKMKSKSAGRKKKKKRA
jgi:hypothetical protein